MHAFCRESGARVDFDTGARNLTTDNRNVQHSWKSHVIDIATTTHYEIVVFGTNLPVPELNHGSFRPVTFYFWPTDAGPLSLALNSKRDARVNHP
jgi:hypothetical protein